MKATEALALQVASNRAPAEAGAHPGEPAPVGENTEPLLSLAVEEKLLDPGTRCAPRCLQRSDT